MGLYCADNSAGSDIHNNVVAKVLSMDMERIKHTMEELDTKNFDEADQKIIHSRRIYIIGVRSAASLAGFLEKQSGWSKAKASALRRWPSIKGL